MEVHKCQEHDIPLNKDCEEKIKEIETEIRRHTRTNTPIIRTKFGRIPWQVLIGDPKQKTLKQSKRRDTKTPEKRVSSSLDRSEIHDNQHLKQDGFDTVSFEFNQPFDSQKFENFVASGLPNGIIRAKGLLWIKDIPRYVIFHLSGRRTNPTELDGRNIEPKVSKLVFIGSGFSTPILEDKLRACLLLS